MKEGIARQQRAKTKRVEKPKKTSRQRARQQTQSLHQPMTNRKTYKIKVPKAQDKKGKGMYKKSIANTSASSESTTVPASQQPLYEPRLWNDGVYYYKHPRHNTDAKREDSPPPPKVCCSALCLFSTGIDLNMNFLFSFSVIILMFPMGPFRNLLFAWSHIP